MIKKIQGDKVIWILVLLLSLVSIAVVYSSVGTLAYRYKGGNTAYYLIKHVLILGLGFLLMYFIHRIKFTYFSRFSQIAVLLAAPLLLYTLLKGVSAGAASRWLEIPGIGLTFQTSDFAKLAIIIYTARVLTKYQDKLDDIKLVFLRIVLPIAIICAFIFPANFSTAALLFMTCLLLMFIGRVPIKYLLYIIDAGAAFLGLILVIIVYFPEVIPRGQTWKNRIDNYMSGESSENYQAEQAKIAVGTSGFFFGKGPGNSTQRGFLPQASSDFIYAILIEEWGLLAGAFVVLLYLILLFRGIRIATKTGKVFGSLVAFGLSFSLVFQAMVNMAVAVNLFPVTGQPLPFVSMGGTSIWFTSITIGIILSISRDLEKENEQQVAENKQNG